MIVMSHCPSA